MKDYLNFIDITIYHPKYCGKYNNHAAIDLPHFYCTMTQNDYPHVWNSWKFATAQPMANQISPLGKRAGFDIKENYVNVLRFELFNDAGLWFNIGVGNPATHERVNTLTEMKSRAQTVNYRRMDLRNMNNEAYLIKRSFFNKLYIFVSIIVENKNGSQPPTYVRIDLTTDGKIVETSDKKPLPVIFKLKYSAPGKLFGYNNVELRDIEKKNVQSKCPENALQRKSASKIQVSTLYFTA